MATAFNPALKATPDQLAQLSRELIATAEVLEQRNTDAVINPEWLAVTRAVMLIDGLRHGLVEVRYG